MPWKETSLQYLLIGLIALSGVGLPVQDALNAQLRSVLKSPMRGALSKTHWWVWMGGGLLGAFAVTIGLIGIPKVSAGIVIAATVLGQLLSAVVIDHFGWFGVPRVPLNPWRIAVAFGLFLCVLMMQKK